MSESVSHPRDVARTLEAAWTIGDLRQLLNDFPDDTRVCFSCDYGDYHHTQQVIAIDDHEYVETCDLRESGYSQSGVALPEEGDVDDEEREALPRGEYVLILR